VPRSGLRSGRIRIPSGGHFQDVGGEFVFNAQHKKNQNRCHQTRFLGSKCTQNVFAAGALPEPRWGISQRSLIPPNWISEPLRDREGSRTGRQRRKRKECGGRGRESSGTEGRGGEEGERKEREGAGVVVLGGGVDAHVSRRQLRSVAHSICEALSRQGLTLIKLAYTSQRL